MVSGASARAQLSIPGAGMGPGLEARAAASGSAGRSAGRAQGRAYLCWCTPCARARAGRTCARPRGSSAAAPRSARTTRPPAGSPAGRS